MSMVKVTKAQASQLVAKTLLRYCELGKQGRVSKGALAALIGISRSRWGQVSNNPNPHLHVETFLSLVNAVAHLERSFEEGVLPLSSKRGSPQQTFCEGAGVQLP